MEANKNKIFRVRASVTTYCYLDIPAQTPEQAFDKGAAEDDSVYIPEDRGSEFEIISVKEITEQIKTPNDSNY